MVKTKHRCHRTSGLCSSAESGVRAPARKVARRRLRLVGYTYRVCVRVPIDRLLRSSAEPAEESDTGLRRDPSKSPVRVIHRLVARLGVLGLFTLHIRDST